jgi:single-stranded DNA-binding protein
MAYEIIGNVFNVGTTETIQTKSGSTLQRRSITLIQRRFDQNTGKEFEPNYPSFEFTNKGCADLDKFKAGDRVRVRFDISGVKYIGKQGEERYFTSLRAFRIETYVPQQDYQPQQQTYQPQQYQAQQIPPQQFPPQAQQYQQYAQQPFPPQQQPFPQIDPQTGLPF